MLFADDDKDISDIRGLTKMCFTFSFYAVQYIDIETTCLYYCVTHYCVILSQVSFSMYFV